MFTSKYIVPSKVQTPSILNKVNLYNDSIMMLRQSIKLSKCPEYKDKELSATILHLEDNIKKIIKSELCRGHEHLPYP